MLIDSLDVSVDELVLDTIRHLDLQSALPKLLRLLQTDLIPWDRMHIADTVYRMTRDPDMAKHCLEAFEKMRSTSGISAGLFYLGRYPDEDVRSVIRRFINDDDELVSASALSAYRRSLAGGDG